MKNAYALKLEARKLAERKALILFSTQKAMDIMTVALNREFGFGRDRMLRLQAAVNELFSEYADMADDVEYAETKLARAVAKIMGEEETC